MRQVLSGQGIDTTTEAAAYLESGYEFALANLYLIGDYDDPAAVRLTDWEGPLAYPIWGTFAPGVVSRGTPGKDRGDEGSGITSKIGLDVADLEFTWTPPVTDPTPSVATANPYQLAQIGYYDNMLFRCWMAIMPTPGDVNTIGAAAIFGGRIAKTQIQRGQIIFTVNSFLDVVDEMVPTNVIELTNTAAGYTGATAPPGHSKIPQLNVEAGSTAGVILGVETSPNANYIFANGAMKGWFLVFNGGAGTTLARQIGRIADNQSVPGGTGRYNQIILYQQLPWPPTAGVDTFYLSASAPINLGALADVVIDAAGNGYVAGDVLAVSGGGGTGAQVQVMTVNGSGGITEAALIFSGSGYVVTTGAATTGGTGTGATFTLSIAPYLGFPYVPQPQVGT